MTNASKFDDYLADCISGGRCIICVSVDAGTHETYAKVKGIDCFEKVRDNLKKYSNIDRGVVALKYIFLPNVNDNEDDIMGFIELCCKLNPGFVYLSFDLNYPVQKLTKNTFYMCKQLMDKLDEKKILWKNVSNVITDALNGNYIDI